MMDLDRVNAYFTRVEESEKTTFRPVGQKLKTGVDLGTAYIVLVVLDEENTCCLTGIEQVFEKVTGIHTVKPANPFLVTPTGIAMNCKI